MLHYMVSAPLFHRHKRLLTKRYATQIPVHDPFYYADFKTTFQNTITRTVICKNLPMVTIRDRPND